MKLEELKKQRDELQESRVVISGELGAVENRIREIEELPRLKKLIGNCYKYRNSYSLPKEESDYWWMYIIVVGVDSESATLQVFTIQQDCHGEINVRTERPYYENMLQTPIGRKEFDEAQTKIIASIAIPDTGEEGHRE